MIAPPASRTRYADSLASAVTRAERPAIARALNLLDDARAPAREQARALLRALPAPETCSQTRLVGFTGPPGVGKSTLISALIAHWRGRDLRVGVLAVDPSSPLSGGALLGDRLRMQVSHGDAGVFIRSLASRGSFGGLSAEVMPMAAVMLNAFDRVVIETVGVGQREVDVACAADCTCLVVQPGAGDSVQFLKAGIMEVPDVLVVNKADLGELARRAHTQLLACLARGAPVTVLRTSALHGSGVPELADALDLHHRRLLEDGALADRRRQSQIAWVVQRLREEFGRHGLSVLGPPAAIEEVLLDSALPILSRLEELRQRVLCRLAPADHTLAPPGADAATLDSPVLSRPRQQGGY